MVLFTADSWVWLEHGEDAFIPVRMIKQAGDKIIAKASTNEVTPHYTRAEPLTNGKHACTRPADNMDGSIGTTQQR